MSFEAEQAVICNILIDNECVGVVLESLTEEMFFDPRNRDLFKSCKLLNSNLQPIDATHLHYHGADTQYLLEIHDADCSAAKAEHHCRLIVETYTKHQVNLKLTEAKRIFDNGGQLDDMLVNIDKALSGLGETMAKDSIRHISEIEVSFEQSDEDHMPTHLSELNNLIIGIKKTDMVVIGGRPGMGKTSMMLDLLVHYGMSKKIPTAFFSLEMTAEQLKQKMVCTWCEIPLRRAKHGMTSADEMNLILESERQFNDSGIYIDKQAGLTPSKLRRKLSRCKRVYGTKIAFVDYMQLMRSDVRGNKYEMMSDVSRSIKEIAVELEIPIIIGSQLNRSVDKRDDKRPMKSDFRDTGAIEEDADVIMCLYRESEYTKDAGDEAELLLIKGRDSGSGMIPLRFRGDITHFVERLVF